MIGCVSGTDLLVIHMGLMDETIVVDLKIETVFIQQNLQRNIKFLCIPAINVYKVKECDQTACV